VPISIHKTKGKKNAVLIPTTKGEKGGSLRKSKGRRKGRKKKLSFSSCFLCDGGKRGEEHGRGKRRGKITSSSLLLGGGKGRERE